MRSPGDLRVEASRAGVCWLREEVLPSDPAGRERCGDTLVRGHCHMPVGNNHASPPKGGQVAGGFAHTGNRCPGRPDKVAPGRC